MYKKFEMELAGRTLRVDVDRVGKTGKCAVLMHYGDYNCVMYSNCF